MRPSTSLFRAYDKLGSATMPVESWGWFVKALAPAFLAYWLHLSQHLKDWLGTEGFRLASPSAAIFVPLSFPLPQLLWWMTFAGGILMFFQRFTAVGSFLAGGGFFYATMCDPASRGALNMHFLFAFAVIFWSTSLRKVGDIIMLAWPAYLIRLYLVVVYFGSGWRKVIYGDWLNNPDALLHCLTGFYTTDLTRWLYPILPLFIWTLIQYASVLFELGAPLLLLHPFFRKWGVVLGCFLHLGIAFLMKDLFYFSFQMLTFYIPVLMPISHLKANSSKRDHQSAI